jgi:hypothetical protein
MSRSSQLICLLAATALPVAGTAHPEARRAAQSLPAQVRSNLPAPAKIARGPERDDKARRAGDRGRSDDRRYRSGRGEFERAKDREGYKFGHHGREVSPGC